MAASQVTDVERAFITEWPQIEHVLPKRPLPDSLNNPFHLHNEAMERGTALELFPHPIQVAVTSWMNYRELEGHKHRSLAQELHGVMHWLLWLKQTGHQLERFEDWNRDQVRAAIEGYFAALQGADMDLNLVWRTIKSFLSGLESLEDVPKPPDLSVIRLYKAERKKAKVDTPEVEIVERIFEDGVCALDRDWNQKRYRLALTLAFSLGVRPGEVEHFHLECLKRDKEQHPCWWIPRFKEHDDTLYPLVDLFHMQRALEFHKEWYDHQVTTWVRCPSCDHQWDGTGVRPSKDGKATCPKCQQSVKPEVRKEYHQIAAINPYYANDKDPDVAKLGTNWRYLLAPPHGESTRKNAKTTARVFGRWLNVALYLAARKNPTGLLQMDTYNPQCQVRFPNPKTNQCPWIAPHDGITQCPLCGRKAEFKRGDECHADMTIPVHCDGVAENGELFCPKCHSPLADLIHMTPNMFRHNSVDRFRQVVGDLALSAVLHRHTPRVEVDSYSHPRPKEIVKKLHQAVGKPKALAQVIAKAGPSTVRRADPIAFDTLIGDVIRRCDTITAGELWGTFEINGAVVVPRETVWTTVEEYYYMARLVYGMEFAIAQLLGEPNPPLPKFLQPEEIQGTVNEQVVKMRNWAKTEAGLRVLENDIALNRETLTKLEEVLHSWIERYGSIETMVLTMRGGTA